MLKKTNEFQYVSYKMSYKMSAIVIENACVDAPHILEGTTPGGAGPHHPAHAAQPMSGAAVTKPMATPSNLRLQQLGTPMAMPRIFSGDLLALLGHFYGNYVEIVGLKAPGNYSASFWINRIPILLLENPKLPSFPLKANYFYLWRPKIKKDMGTFSKNIIFISLMIWEIGNFEMLDKIWKRQAPKHDDHPLNRISRILDTGPIFLKT